MISKLNNYIWYWLCIFLIWLLLFVFVSFCMLIRNDSLTIKNEMRNFEKETWLDLEQVSEKYHINKDLIIEKYNEIKYNQQNLEGEISNALNKTK